MLDKVGSQEARSYLYVPADNEQVLAKSMTRDAGAVILDLEDSVAASSKTSARSAAIAFAEEYAGHQTEIWVRVNSGELGLEELEAFRIAIGVDGIWLPKVEPGPWLDNALDKIASGGMRAGLLLESARGLRDLASLPELPRDTLMQIGEVDLAASLSISGSEDQMLVFRSMVVLECAARALPSPVAPVSVSWDDPQGFRLQTERLRDWGFAGRACIHPAQVLQVNAVWGEDDDRLERARTLLREFDERQSEGVGVFRAKDGTMADVATVRWARSMLSAKSKAR